MVTLSLPAEPNCSALLHKNIHFVQQGKQMKMMQYLDVRIS